jgi:integrase
MRDNKLYAVINLYDLTGTRKRRNINTKFNPRNEKTQAKEFLNQLLRILNNRDYHEINFKFIKIIDGLTPKNICADAADFLKKLDLKLNDEKRKVPLPNMNAGGIDINMPFSEYMRRWLLTKTKVEDNTYNGYDSMINAQGRIADYFDNIGATLYNLRPEDFEEYYEYLYSNGLVECTILKHHRLMYQALKYAVKKGPLFYNILDKVDSPCDGEFTGDYFKAPEALELLEKSKEDPMYITILLTTYYGFRRSEVLGLRWSCVDFENMTITVERKIIKVMKDGKSVLQDKKKLKSKSSHRGLPLIPVVAAALKQEYSKQQEYKRAFSKGYYSDPDGHICVSVLGKPFSPDYITNHYKTMLKNFGLRNIRFHDLRHTCATLLVINGISLLAVSRWLGHSSLAVTEKFYLHFDVKAQIDLALKMGEILPHNLTADVREYVLKK